MLRWLVVLSLVAACGDNLAPQLTTACKQVTDCPATDSDCLVAACTMGQCRPTPVAAGTAVSAQVAGDCHQVVCDGSGGTMTVEDDGDAPAGPNECVTFTCADGTPQQGLQPIGAACGSGLQCDGAGDCVNCNVASQCPGSDTDCQFRTCFFGVCSLAFEPSGTARTSQVAGDCQKSVCDGAGGGSSIVDTTDVPNDHNACTGDQCSAQGVPSNPDLPIHTTCGGGDECDGSGDCVQCTVASECPGSDTECETRTCSAQGACGFTFQADGHVLTAQTVGDCEQQQCDGAGNIVQVVDTSDVPDDHNACTSDACSATGVPSNTDLPAHTSCGGTLECDGNGACVGCVLETDCPGHDDACEQRTCIVGSCGVANTPAGTTVPGGQIAGDCHELVCDGNGNTVNVEDDTDVPVDGETCTTDLCSAGVPSNPPVAAETACSEGTGSRCNGSGACVECIVEAECPGGPDSACHIRTCSLAGACGLDNPPNGSLAPAQTSGDCEDVDCDGAGGAFVVEDDTDVPVDGNACTQDVCTTGVPSNPLEPDGFSCAVAGNGNVCDTIHGVATCVGSLGSWKPAGNGWTGGVPCADGIRFNVDGSFVWGCSTTAGFFVASKVSGVETWTQSNTGIDNLAGLGLGLHSTVSSVVGYLAQPIAGKHNWFMSNASGATFAAALAITDTAGNLRFIPTQRFQAMVGDLWGTNDAVTGEAVVLTGTNSVTATNPVTVSSTMTGSPIATGTVRAIVAGKSGGTDMFVAVFGQTPSGATATGGVFHATVKGTRYDESDSGIAAADLPLVYSIIADPAVATNSTLYVAVQGGGQVYKSTTDGVSWVQANSGLPAAALVNVIAIDASNDSIVYAATNVGLYESTDGAATWSLVGFAGRVVSSVTVSPASGDDANIFVGVDDDVGLYVPGP